MAAAENDSTLDDAIEASLGPGWIHTLPNLTGEDGGEAHIRHNEVSFLLPHSIGNGGISHGYLA